jgi:NodT family efflux transporter outer membrane factor (OMF) lipoprotein
MSSLPRILLLTLGTVLVTACAVGPNYHRPAADTGSAFKELGDWKPSEPADTFDRGPWWQIFKDPVLEQLEQQIDVSNQTLKQAVDTYRQAKAMVDQAEAGFWPSINGTASYTRQKGSGIAVLPSGAASTLTNTYSAGANASWTLDVFGQVRRTVESNFSAAQSAAAAVAGTRLLEQATLAQDYFNLRGQDELKRILDQTVDDEQKSLKITQNQYAVGVAAKADVVTAQTQLLASQAQQINAGILRATLEHAIAVLVGKVPSEFSVAAEPTMPTEVPTVPAGLASTLLERRPDVAEAERKMQQENALIGVAVSAYFPSLTLAGAGSYQSSTLSNLFTASNRVWSFGPELAMSLFDGGLRRAETAAARAVYDQSVDSYRQTVLTAFQQVEDDLATLRILEQQATVEDETVKMAKEAERLVLNQYKAGTVPYSSVITAQNTTFSAEQTALTVLQTRFTTSIAMIEALGGGWSTKELPK